MGIRSRIRTRAAGGAAGVRTGGAGAVTGAAGAAGASVAAGAATATGAGSAATGAAGASTVASVGTGAATATGAGSAAREVAGASTGASVGTGAATATSAASAVTGAAATATGADPAATRAAVAATGGAVAVTAALVAALTVAVVNAVRTGGVRADPGRILLWYGVAWALFAAAAWSVRKVPVRAAAALILAGGAAVAVAGLAAPPSTSSDMYRYAWDGRVQAAGISPYAHAPVAPRLAPLREGWLFPPGARCRDPGLVRKLELHTAPGVCTRINRPAVHTIYPPVAEGWFLAVYELSPGGSRHKAMQVGGAALAVGTTAALLVVIRRRGGDPRAAALWAWCPAVPVEAVNNAHIDTLGVLFTVLALGTATAGARRGALLGAAVAVKLYPVLALPGALAGAGSRSRRAVRVAGAAVGVVALAYLPYVLASGAGVLGYLPGYLHEEGYESGSVHRFALLRLVLPDAAAGPAAALLLLLAAGYAVRRGDPDRPWRGALLVTGAAMLLTSPAYSWYALLVVALVALDGRWEWLAVPAAGAALYIGGAAVPKGVDLQSLTYGAAALAVLAGAAVRARRGAGGPGGPVVLGVRGGLGVFGLLRGAVRRLLPGPRPAGRGDVPTGQSPAGAGTGGSAGAETATGGTSAAAP